MSKWRTPEQMSRKEEKRPVSARIKTATHSYLEKRASKAGISLSQLLETIIEEYASWLRTQR